MLRAAALAYLLGASHVVAAFSEAPNLTAEVRAGRLPPLERRMPAAPLVITPIDKPGYYGGTWRMLLNGYDHGALLSRSIGYEPLVRWDPNWSRVLPNLASSWTVSPDAKVYQFRLRTGLRWSDGQPFTAHDVVAWMDDVARDPELNPVPPAWLLVGGHLPQCLAVDDTLLEFRFPEPNALFLEQLAGMRANELTRYPAHYFRPFHRRHNPAAARALAEQTGLPWPQAFGTRLTPRTWRNLEVPTLDAWVLATPYVPGVTNVLARRNPYYWKVDTLGRQLPYLDEIQFRVVSDEAELVQRVLAGEVDYQREGAPGRSFQPQLLAAAKQSGSIPVRVIPSIPGPVALNLNLTHRDPEMRRILGNREVRIALSLAIQRHRIIKEVYHAQGRPWQVAPRPESPFNHPTLGMQFTEYAPERAGRLLDAAGLTHPTAEALRSLPDGRPFRLEILVPELGSPEWPAVLEHIQRDWRSVGVELTWRVVPREPFYALVADNRHDAVLWWGGGGHAAMLEPEYYVPVTFERLGALRVFYAVPWAQWFLDPHARDAEQPPPTVLRQMDLFRRLMAEPESSRRFDLMRQVIDIAAQEFYVIGICLESVGVAPRNPAFRNVPATHFDSWLYPDPGPLNPCQFFIDPSVPQ